MNLLDQVTYSENGKDYLATVLGIRELDHHHGKSGEPLLHLGFFKPVLDENGEPKKLVGTSDAHQLVQFRVDVAHDSHEFDDIAQRKGFKGVYPGGRWKEIAAAAEPSTELVPVGSDPAGAPTDDGGSDEQSGSGGSSTIQ